MARQHIKEIQSSIGILLARVDERVESMHSYLEQEVKPALTAILTMKETVKWVKAGVIGIYTLIGSGIIAAIAQALTHK